MEQLQPFGEKAENVRAGILWSLLATVYGKKGKKAVTAMDYPLIKNIDSKFNEAQKLHQQFLKFKARYESIKPNA